MEISEEEINAKLDKYFRMTDDALKMVQIIAENKESKEYLDAIECLDMAKNYLDDAKHFRDNGELLTALAAASYAHAWLDAGARLQLFTVDNSTDLFTVDSD